MNTQTAEQTKATSTRRHGLAGRADPSASIRIGRLAITVETRGSYLAANAAVAATPVVLAAVSVGGGLASTLIPSHAATSPLAARGFGATAPTRILAMREPALPGSARLQLGSSVSGLDELTQRSTTLSLALGQGRSEPASSALAGRAPLRGSGKVRGGAAVRVAAPARTGRTSAALPGAPRPAGSVHFAIDSGPGPVAPRVVPAVPSETHRVSGGSSEGVSPAPALADLAGTQMLGTYQGRQHASPGRRWHSHRPTGSNGTGTERPRGRGGRTSPAPAAATSTTITEPDLTPATTGTQTATSPPTSGNGGDTGAISPATTSIGPTTAAAATIPATTTGETPPPTTTAPEATPTTTGTQTTSPPPTTATTATTTETPSPTDASTPLPGFQTPAPAPATGSQTTSAASTPNSSAQVYVATDGNDATCARNNPNAPCATLDEADAIAQPGDTIQVAPGTYPDVANDGYGAGIFHDTQATYVCAPGAAAQSVTFDSPGFLVGPGGGNVTIEGSCFSFHVVHVGLDGYNSSSCADCRVENVTFDDVSMDSFEVAGAENVTIADSTVGPLVACYAAGDGSGAPGYADCPAGSYWASQGGTAAGGQDEPFIHNNGPDIATDVTLQGDTIEGISSLWDGTHTGGLLFWSTADLHILDTTFADDAIYDILENQDSTDTGLELEGNTFGNPVYSQDPTENPGAPLLAPGWQEVELGSSGDTLTDATVSGNTFTNGMRFGDGSNTATYGDVTVADNTLGSDTTCGPTAGITFAGNDSCNS